MQPIVVRYREEDPKGDRFEVVQPIDFDTVAGPVRVPVGYVTDFASSPMWLWSLVPPIGPGCRAFLLHDYWYDNRLFEQTSGEYRARLMADDALYYALCELQPKRWFWNYLIYAAVRLFGRSWWIN